MASDSSEANSVSQKTPTAGDAQTKAETWLPVRPPNATHALIDPRPIFERLLQELPVLEIDQIREHLDPLRNGMSMEAAILNPGTFLYRARRVNDRFNKQSGIAHRDLIYPPPRVAAWGRLNRPNAPVFYCSLGKEPVFFEVGELGPGDELVLTFWKTSAEMLLSNIGYTQHVFERLGARRACPTLTSQRTSSQTTLTLPDEVPIDLGSLPEDTSRAVRLAFSEHFMCEVTSHQTYRYKLTTAIGELHLGDIGHADDRYKGPMRFAGVMYPSVRLAANADNVALQPWFVDEHLRLTKAVHIRIDSRKGMELSFTTLDAATEFRSDGTLNWLGHDLNWTVPKGGALQFEAVSGPDEHGDYLRSPDGKPVHWQVTEELAPPEAISQLASAEYEPPPPDVTMTPELENLKRRITTSFNECLVIDQLRGITERETGHRIIFLNCVLVDMQENTIHSAVACPQLGNEWVAVPEAVQKTYEDIKTKFPQQWGNKLTGVSGSLQETPLSGKVYLFTDRCEIDEATIATEFKKLGLTPILVDDDRWQSGFRYKDVNGRDDPSREEEASA